MLSSVVVFIAAVTASAGLVAALGLIVRRRLGASLHASERRLHDRLGREIANLSARLRSTADRVDRLTQDARAARQAAKELRGARHEIDSLDARLGKLERADPAARLALEPLFDRTLSHAAAERIIEFWAPRLGIETSERQLLYFAQAIGSLESQLMGRLAADTADEILRVLALLSLARRDPVALEIGSLFGINLAVTHRLCSPLQPEVRFVALDPLDGYYGAAQRDPVTGLPITEDVFWSNMRLAGVPAEQVRLIKEMSSGDAVPAMVGTSAVDYLLIDGDHTYAGVRNDFERFLDSVRAGGLILFDDYAKPNDWPDVSRYVDAEAKRDARVSFIGADWHTAVFRKLS